MFSRAKKIFRAFSPRERIVFLVASVLALVGAALLFGIFLRTSTEVVPARGGDYEEGLVGQPSFVNPVIAQSETDKTLVHLIFSSLKDIASKIEPSQDGRVWRVRLKEGVVWHNGEKLTSDDVIFTVQKIQNLDTRSPLFSSWQGIFAQRLSEREVQFTLGAPYAFFETTHLANLFILPKHLFADIPPANWRLSEFNLRPVGSGPYEFASYDAEENGFLTAYRVRANRRYFGDAPLVEQIVLRFFRKKAEVLEAFNAGQIEGFPNLEPKDLEALKRPYALTRFRIPQYYAVFINQNQHLALKEKEVRNALNLALPRDELVEEILRGFGDVAHGPLPEVIANGKPKESHSFPAAARVLDEAGWALNDDEVRLKNIKNASITLSFALTVPETSFLTETARRLKMAWENIGARIDIHALPVSDLLDGAVKSRDYQLLLFGNILSPSFDLFSFWHSSERFYPGSNLSLYNNKEADALIESIKEGFDPERRKENFRKLAEIIAEEVPAIFLYSPEYLYAHINDLKGLDSSLIAEPAERFDNIEKWHLRTRRVFK